jgi:hypothetical protein
MGSRPVTRQRPQRKSQAESDLGFEWGPLNTALLGAGVAVLVVGYFALSRGSVTLAPLLLVLGYCALIPASLLVRRGKPATGE